jgi:SAM-dependent methyltransferase
MTTEDSPMSDIPFAQADAHWLELLGAARNWFSGPLGRLLLEQEQRLLDEQLARLFGGFLVHYGPCAESTLQSPQIHRSVRLGAPFDGVEIACAEQYWPLLEHAADVVVLQHGLDFCLSPHGLLREAARSVRPGGHLLVLGINPLSAWGLRHLFAGDVLRQARCIVPGRLCDWLNLLGFALEKPRFGCYRPPLASAAWQHRLAALERWGNAWKSPGGGFYLLVARKRVVGLRPLRESPREPRGLLLPMPVAKVSRRSRGDS